MTSLRMSYLRTLRRLICLKNMEVTPLLYLQELIALCASNREGQARGRTHLLNTRGAGSPFGASPRPWLLQMNLPIKRSLSTVNHGNIRNTISLSLNGSNSEVLESYKLSITHMRFWNVSLGNSINFKILLGCEMILHTTPPTGTFHFIIKFSDKSINLIINGRTGWLCGGANAKAIFLLKSSENENYITHECTSLLSFVGCYYEIVPMGLSQLAVGLPALRDAVTTLAEHDGISESPNLRYAFGTVVFHLLEAYKFHRVFELVCRTIEAGQLINLGHSSDPTIVELVKKWGKFSHYANRCLFNAAYGRKQPIVPEILRKNLGGVGTVQSIVENIFLAPYDSIGTCNFKFQPPTSPFWGPIDPGKGDILLLEKFNLRNLVPLQRERFLRDREFYFGDRAGGSPHESVFRFVRNPLNGTRNAWMARLPLKSSGQKLPILTNRPTTCRPLNWAAKLAKTLKFFKK